MTGLKLYRHEGHIYGLHEGKLWHWRYVSGVWGDETLYDASDVPMMQEIEGDAGLHPYSRSLMEASLRSHLGYVAQEAEERRAKLRELFDNPDIWTQLSSLAHSVKSANRAEHTMEDPSRLEMRDSYKDTAAKELEKLLNMFREEGFK